MVDGVADSFEEITIESTETIDAGDEVFAGILQRGRPHGSRAVVEDVRGRS